MNILGILGSARKRGNTEILLDIALKEAKGSGVEVSKLSLSDKSIAPCNGCGKCCKTGKCVIKDDMEEVYRKMLAADGILWATPVYFWSMTGQTKIVMDRTYALSFPELQLANKVGGLIAVARNRGCMNTSNIFHMYFRYNAMFHAESVNVYAGERGEIKKNTYAAPAVKESISQIISMINARLQYPDANQGPLHRLVKKKYSL